MKFAELILTDDKKVLERLASGMKLSLEDMFSSMFKKEISFGPYQVLASVESDFDYSGVASVVDGSIQGLMVLSFKRKTLFQLLAVFYNKDFEMASEEVNQGVAEMTNIVFGNLKGEAAKLGFSFKEIIPSVISGQTSHKNLFHGEYKVMSLPCDVDGDGVALNIIVRKSES